MQRMRWPWVWTEHCFSYLLHAHVVSWCLILCTIWTVISFMLIGLAACRGSGLPGVSKWDINSITDAWIPCFAKHIFILRHLAPSLFPLMWVSAPSWWIWFNGKYMYGSSPCPFRNYCHCHCCCCWWAWGAIGDTWEPDNDLGAAYTIFVPWGKEDGSIYCHWSVWVPRYHVG